MSQTSSSGIEQNWPWPDSLDALRAAPAHHELLLENERVRVIHTHIPVGDTVPLHTHRWAGVAYVIQSGDFIRRDQNANVLFDSRQVGPPPSSPVPNGCSRFRHTRWRTWGRPTSVSSLWN